MRMLKKASVEEQNREGLGISLTKSYNGENIMLEHQMKEIKVKNFP